MRDIIVFGTGEFWRRNQIYLRENYHIRALIDNRVEENKVIDFGDGQLKIYNPNQITKFPDCEVMIMNKRYYIAMYEQLRKLGVIDERIKLGILLQPQTEKELTLCKEKGKIYASEGHICYSSESVDRMILHSEKDLDEYAALLTRERKRRENPLICAIARMPLQPASIQFGLERGNAIDRIYIEKFLENNRQYITGNCMEIAEDTYTLKYGHDVRPYILHVEGWGKNSIKGNLETGEGIPDNFFDCAIITQTLMFTYELQSVAFNIYRTLKQNGTALLTVSGISQISMYDAENWGSYYSFHPDALKKLFNPLFGEQNVQIESFGNVKTAIGMLYGLCYEDLAETDFLVNDGAYPVIITIRLKKE